MTRLTEVHWSGPGVLLLIGKSHREALQRHGDRPTFPASSRRPPRTPFNGVHVMLVHLGAAGTSKHQGNVLIYLKMCKCIISFITHAHALGVRIYGCRVLLRLPGASVRSHRKASRAFDSVSVRVNGFVFCSWHFRLRSIFAIAGRKPVPAQLAIS